MANAPPSLGKLEREVMQHVWALGTTTADSVRELLPRAPKELTVRTVLRRLENKGYLKHTVAGRTFLYSPVEARGQVAAKAVKRIIDWFCDGSVEEVLVGMVDSAVLDSNELRVLSEKIAKAKKRKK